LIVTALAAGAAAATENTVTSAVADAYQGLKAMVRARLSGRRDGQAALDQLDDDPAGSVPVLTAELGSNHVGTDTALTQAAERLIALLDTGRYEVDARHAMGVQVGDNNTQTNTFNLPPTDKNA
jgi:hypothetical protein